MSIEKAKLMKLKLENEKESLAKLAEQLTNSKSMVHIDTLYELVQATIRISLANSAILEEILEVFESK